MLNTFENSDRFHSRRLERQRHLQNMEEFSMRVGSGDRVAVTSMADAFSGDPLARIEEDIIPTKPRNRLWSKLAISLTSVSVLLVVCITSLFVGMKLNEKDATPTESSSNSSQDYVRYEELFSSIMGWGLTPRDRLEDASSPQGMALAWLASNDFSTDNPDNLKTRFALATLFYGTQNETAGLSWTRKNYWLSNCRT
jgi:hypothetical protein